MASLKERLLETKSDRAAALTRTVGTAFMINGLFRPVMGVLVNNETSNSVSPIVPFIGMLLIVLSYKLMSVQTQLTEETRSGLAAGLASSFFPSLDIFPTLFALSTLFYGAVTVGRTSAQKFLKNDYQKPPTSPE